MSKKLAKAFNCPTEFTLAVLGGKWKTVILCYLKLRPFRYSELRVLHPNLSDKMLTERLQDLIDVGLVARRKSTGRKTIATYSLTDRGRSLHPLLGELYGWGEAQAAVFGVKVDFPLARLKPNS
jgi:DNA-binding HxlR family transcriptional regulator